MNIHKTFLAITFAAAAIPAAYANSGATFVGGEAGYQTHVANGSVTRAQVLNELAAFRAHPVQHDGTVFVGGEIGFTSPSNGASADRTPARPHTHVLGNAGNSAGSGVTAPVTEAQRRVYQEQYIN